MSIGTIGSTSASYAVQSPGSGRGQDIRSKVESAVANKLGISTDDLQTALQSGKSLADVAAANGVSRDDLISTISSALQSAGVGGSSTATAATTGTTGTSSTTGPDLTQMATRIADRVGGGHHHHHAGTSSSSSSSATSAAAVLSALTGATGATRTDNDGDGSGGALNVIA